MKRITTRQILLLLRWNCIWIITFALLSFFISEAMAQEPTPIPTPTPLPTWTPGPVATHTPTPVISVSPTPVSSTATPSGRLVDFRVDDDEIDKGDCVQFSWVVRGDIDRVEFDEEGDDKAPLLVSDMDSREECPEKETDYKLVVRWLDGTETTNKIEIDIVTSNSGGSSSSSSGSSSGDGSTGSGEVGEFVPVTPILLATETPVPEIGSTTVPNAEEISAQPAVYESTSQDSQIPKPAGLLGTVKTLPETGLRPVTAPTPNDSTATRLYLGLGLAIFGGSMVGLGSAGLGLVWLIWCRSRFPR